eukprot:scaffold26329_cov47-Attheya_sp.AAC.2
MEVPEQVSEPPGHYMTPTANTPDCRRCARRCDRAAATLLLLEESWEVGRNCLLGQYEASGGVWRNRLAKEGGLNEEEEEEDNWITRLQ